jgi:isopentenyl phosphate kinase
MTNSKIVIKLGGGLITDKTQLKTIRENEIKAVCEVLSDILENGNSVILVHGAGSFGHLEAKKWGLATGYDSEIKK